MSTRVYELRFPTRRTTGPKCWAISDDGYICTRRDQHTGRHAATGAEYVLRVWSDR